MINRFEGKYSFLSNFYQSTITDGNLMFPTVEHMFQAAKSINLAEYEKIACARTPNEAKYLGRNCTIREDWEEVKEQVMYKALVKKFSIPELQKALLATGDEELIEGNYWHDNTWGDCYCDRCKDIKGQNLLGKLLMQIREEIKSSM